MIPVFGVAERKMVFKRLERKKKEVVVVDSLFRVLFVCIVKLSIIYAILFISILLCINHIFWQQF